MEEGSSPDSRRGTESAPYNSDTREDTVIANKEDANLTASDADNVRSCNVNSKVSEHDKGLATHTSTVTHEDISDNTHNGAIDPGQVAESNTGDQGDASSLPASASLYTSNDNQSSDTDANLAFSRQADKPSNELIEDISSSNAISLPGDVPNEESRTVENSSNTTPGQTWNLDIDNSFETSPQSSGIPLALDANEDTASKEQHEDTVKSPESNEFSRGEETALLPINTEREGAENDGGSGEVVVVTGGCGFLGQHVVKMLQERAPHVAEIRVLDVKEFVQRLDYTAKKPVRSIVGSVADSKTVSQAVKGAHAVIHVAGIISWGTFPDFAGMEETNVIGTLNVFNACLKNNVQRLLYCSTVDVAVGFQPIYGGDEENTAVPPPDGFMFPGYPETKYQGERIILNSERVRRQDGETLQTVILRANVLYGELDNAYVINGLRGARQGKGTLRQIGDGMAMFQQSYVGNTAWAFVRANIAMRENPDLTAEVFYVPDNTPVQNSFNFMRPYLEVRGFRLSEDQLSYALVHSAVRVAEVLARGLSPIYKLNLPVQSHSLQYINTNIYFSGEKARRVLGYEPIFTPIEARQACLEYYKTVDLN